MTPIQKAILFATSNAETDSFERHVVRMDLLVKKLTDLLKEEDLMIEKAFIHATDKKSIMDFVQEIKSKS